MVRALASACVVLVLCFGGAAWGKPKIAILGLEAAPGPSGSVDPSTTQVARAITKELRHRAQAVASPYSIAPNSNKELTDEKLLMSCDNEAASCMAVIGAGLAADVLLYGRVEKKGEVYRVSLKRLDVKTKTIEAGGEELPVGTAVVGMSKRLYFKLVGQTSASGSLVVKATSQTGRLLGNGSVMVDDEPRGALSDGRITVAGLSEGRHVLAIEAGGYRRFEETVTIHAGEQATLNALLLRQVGDEPASGGGATLWKVSLGTSLVVGAAGGALAIYSYQQMNQNTPEFDRVPGSDLAPIQVTSDDCGLSDAEIAETKHAVVDRGVFDKACSARTRIYYGLAVAGVGVVGAAISIVMLMRSSDAQETPRTGARSQKPSVAFTPIVTPTLTGGSLSLHW